MTDPFELLRDELVRAAERSAAANPRRGSWRPGWLRGRQGLAVALAALLVAGGAAAAATVLSGEQSKPLSGVVPPGQQPHTALAAGQRYTVGFAPSIQAGQIGWCVSTRTFSATGRAQDEGTGGCNTPAATTGAPVLGTDSIVNGGGLSYVFTTGAVAAIRIAGGPTVLTRPSLRLPDGYRAAVFEYQPPKGTLGLTRIPGGAPSLITALSASGREIVQDSSGSPAEPTRSWLYPHAPATGVCSLSGRPGSSLRAGSGSVLTAAVAAPTITGAAFLPCVTEDLYLPRHADHPDAPAGLGSFLVGAILLDAARPGRSPAVLPGMRLIPASGGIYDSPDADVFAGNASRGLAAKRIANAWLVVAGGISVAQRTRALNDLIPDVNLTRTAASPVSPPGRCARSPTGPSTACRRPRKPGSQPPGDSLPPSPPITYANARRSPRRSPSCAATRPPDPATAPRSPQTRPRSASSSRPTSRRSRKATTCSLPSAPRPASITASTGR